MLLITTSVVNNPKFIELQNMTLKKFIKNPYKFVVYNDAKDWSDYSNFYDPLLKKEISSLCSKLNIECIEIDNNKHQYTTIDASTRCADACNYMLKDHLKYNGRTLVIDSDMFLINYLDVDEKYKGFEMAAVPQIRQNCIPYIWNGLVYYNMPIVKNKQLLKWDLIGKAEHGITDVGGSFYYYLINTPNAQIYSINHLYSCSWNRTQFSSKLNTKLLNFLENDPKNVDNKFFAEIYDDTYLHYRAGGNWIKEGKELHDKRTDLLWNTIVDIVQ